MTHEEFAPNPSTALARVLVDELVRNGVEHAVIAPGSRSAALAFALEAEPNIAVHMHPDERSAAFVALGIARISRRPAVVVTTSGSAVANLLPAVVEADLGRIPLVLLTADRPLELRDTGANQTIRQADLFASTTRWSFDLAAAEDRAESPGLWRGLVCRAVAASTGSAGPAGAAGPVHLNVAFREPSVPTASDGRRQAEPWRHDLSGRPNGAPWVVRPPTHRTVAAGVIDTMIDLLCDGPRLRPGVIVVGETAGDLEHVVAFGQRLGWPVLAEPVGDVRARDGVLAAGHYLCADDRFLRSHRPDVVIRVGKATLSPAIDRMAEAATTVVIDRDGDWLDPTRTMAQLVAAEPAAVLSALLERLGDAPPCQDGAWYARWRQAAGIVEAALAAALVADGTLSEPLAARCLADALPADSHLFAASSMPVRDLDRFLPSGTPIRVFTNRGASGIDGFVGTLLGMRLATPPPTPVVGIAGDLATLHDSNGWLLSPDDGSEQGSVTLVVIDNDGGGIFSMLPQAQFVSEGFERLFGTPHGRDLSHLARFHKLDSVTVADAHGFVTALGDAVRRPGRHMVHVRTDRGDNAELHRLLDAHVAASLAAQDWSGGS